MPIRQVGPRNFRSRKERGLITKAAKEIENEPYKPAEIERDES